MEIDWGATPGCNKMEMKGCVGRHQTLSSLMASSFFSSALVGSCHATVSPFPLGEDGGLIPLIRRPEDNK